MKPVQKFSRVMKTTHFLVMEHLASILTNQGANQGCSGEASSGRRSWVQLSHSCGGQSSQHSRSYRLPCHWRFLSQGIGQSPTNGVDCRASFKFMTKPFVSTPTECYRCIRVTLSSTSKLQRCFNHKSRKAVRGIITTPLPPSLALNQQCLLFNSHPSHLLFSHRYGTNSLTLRLMCFNYQTQQCPYQDHIR